MSISERPTVSYQDSVRFVFGEEFSRNIPCMGCGRVGGQWDRVAGRVLCPDCVESLAQGEGHPLVARTEQSCCAACDQKRTVAYVTYPLDTEKALQMDLCHEHVRALLGRRLGPKAFRQLCERLLEKGMRVEQIFLLHDEFYDAFGRALQPIKESE